MTKTNKTDGEFEEQGTIHVNGSIAKDDLLDVLAQLHEDPESELTVSLCLALPADEYLPDGEGSEVHSLYVNADINKLTVLVLPEGDEDEDEGHFAEVIQFTAPGGDA